MNSATRNFLYRNRINPRKFSRISGSRIKLPSEINEIVYKYGFYKQRRRNEDVSIADIEGYDYSWRQINPNIIYSIDDFFDQYGDEYHKRSIGLLDYNAKNAIRNINFKDKIIVREMGDNRYIISANGLHRYTVLRILYLNEDSKTLGIDKKALKEKYTIPVEVEKLDELKTYSKYLLMHFPCGVKDVEREYNIQNWIYTGRIIIEREDGEKIILEADENLIEYVKSQAGIINQNIGDIQDSYNKYPSFRKFLQTYCKDFIDIKLLEEKRAEMEGLKGDERI